MNFKDYQKRSYIAIQPHIDKKDEVLNWTVGLAEEVGEVLNLIKHNYWGEELVNKEELAKELGDILWYASALARVFNLNFQAVAELNVNKLEHRFKEGEFSEKASKERKERENNFKETDVYKKIVKELIL